MLRKNCFIKVLVNVKILWLKIRNNTLSQYILSLSLTIASVSSARVINFDIHCEGGLSGAMLILGAPFSPATSIDATLKFFPHSLQILRPRHFSTNTRSGSLRLTTKSMSVTSVSIS